MPRAERYVANERRMGTNRPKRRRRGHASLRRRRPFNLRHGRSLYVLFSSLSLIAVASMLTWSFLIGLLFPPSITAFLLLFFFFLTKCFFYLMYIEYSNSVKKGIQKWYITKFLVSTLLFLNFFIFTIFLLIFVMLYKEY